MKDAIFIAVALIVAFILGWMRAPRHRRSRSRRRNKDGLRTPIPLDITVLFANLDDFVTVFERIGHQRGALIISEYYSIMTPIIRRHDGYLQQRAFDSLFICFGPILSASRANHAEQAIRAALDMQNAMDLLNDRLTAQGLPQVRMRAGIATGQAIVGDIGTPEFSQFTAIGPAVNAARNLEKACKATEARNLVDREARARTLDVFRFRTINLPRDSSDPPIESFEAIGRI
jgi:adenylate cyclase